jgi:hypothetical protein
MSSDSSRRDATNADAVMPTFVAFGDPSAAACTDGVCEVPAAQTTEADDHAPA